ncbi:uncharacterized protein LOC132720846 [Ruditapes philippinarum]|uniref:uncharacterized protein LOC132720846 n=1 Tax=Ruditapes philippinarum TaxID=129788 RepID=UPI00295A735F|nr:uncharacterized protein LOC132720846 [Ruditapes philippinarum]
MECRVRARLQYQAAVIQARIDLLDANVDIVAYENRRRRRRLQRWLSKAWLGPERHRMFGLYDQLMMELRREDQRSFTNFMRMPPEMFDEILERVGPRITKQYTTYRTPLDPGMKLAVTLRHLASGSKYSNMRFAWRIPHNTISVIVREVCRAIIDEYVDEVMPLPTTAADWKRILDGFLEKWNFPHTLGALDGKHIACKCPPSSGSTYFNYKKYYSIVLLALVDYDCKFIWADIGGRGAASDAQLWNESDLKAATEELDLPDAEPLPHDTQDVPFFYIGDDAFGLKTYMQKPYSHRVLSHDERIFNYRLSRARRVVENAFGILANRFQVLMSTMQHHPSTIRLIGTTCLVLHNQFCPSRDR